MSSDRPVALVTGASRRIGAAIAEGLHDAGWAVAAHHRGGEAEAKALCARLEHARPYRAELASAAECGALSRAVIADHGRLDLLVNNASSFFPTRLGETGEAQWEALLASNLKAPFFLSQACADALAAGHGSIVNITDIYARRPLRGYPVYCAAKAGLAMLTRALARELGPAVRVNAVAPGSILWPESGPHDEASREAILERAALKRQGEPADVAGAVLYLAGASYVTGHELVVDGGQVIGP